MEVTVDLAGSFEDLANLGEGFVADEGVVTGVGGFSDGVEAEAAGDSAGVAGWEALDVGARRTGPRGRA